MDSYPGVTPLWDLSQATTFSQLPDDDFLALLQKQFPNNSDFSTGVFQGSIDPQAIQPFALPGLSPPSDDSSPSPQSGNNDRDSRSQSRHRGDADGDDSILKRKASADSFDDEPSQKNQHTAGDKRASTGRRKSTGNPDETRLLKRKEQNRAAQRAFRERKEKHVKDLEDKVAALEAKNEQATSENVNLRDLLTRLQDENVTLKQAAFTFSVPKPAAAQPIASGSGQSPMNLYSASTSLSPASAFSPPPGTLSPKPVFSDHMDWTSLTTFDPAVLALLDDSPPPQTTATDSAMFMDYGFGSSVGQSAKSPFTTIAANPQFMSFADFDIDTPSDLGSGSAQGSTFNFDMWNSPHQSFTSPRDNVLDDLFGGNFVGEQGLVDFNALMASSPTSVLHSPSIPISPVIHKQPPRQQTGSGSSSTSSLSPQSDPRSPVSSAGTSPAAEPEIDHHSGECPKTKADIAKAAAAGGQSMMVTHPVSPKPGDEVMGKTMACKGSGFPPTEPRPDDVEVLTAWRGLTSAAGVKDVDINQLCSEFSSKAKCDGTKVVLDQTTYQNMLAKLAQQGQK